MLQPKTDSEIEVLVQIASDLPQAATPADWLEAVSDYARSRGAVAGFLLWILSGPEATTIEAEIAASWTQDEKPHLSSQDRLILPAFWYDANGRLDATDRPLLIENTQTSPLLDESMREYYGRLDVGAVALLPQLVQGRWVSLLGFHWREPQAFDDQFRRICEIIIRRAGPAINAIRLLDQNRERALRAERLSEINTALSQAGNEDEILAAMLACARSFTEHAPHKMSLLYVNLDSEGKPIEAFNAASIGPLVYMAEKNKIYSLDDTPFPMIASLNSEDPIFVEDMGCDPRFLEADREIARNVGNCGGVLLPLRSANTWQGVMMIIWQQPRIFSEQERYLYTRLLPTLASVVARRRAYLETRESQSEASSLYHLAERINAATSYQEIVDTVASLQPECDGVFLNFREHLDYDRASYLEMIATAAIPDAIEAQVQMRLPKLAVSESAKQEKLWILENAYTELRHDAQARDFFSALPTKAFMGVPLRSGERLWGMIVISYVDPRKFSERDRRLALGIGDLVATATERVRLQSEMQQSNEEADFLYRMAESVNTATTYQEVMEAVATILPDSAGVYLDLWEHYDYEKASYVEIVAAANVPGEFRNMLGRHLPKSSFPISEEWLQHRLIVVEDIETEESIDPAIRDNWLRLGTRAFVGVSFHHENTLVGGIFFNFTRPREFAEREQRLALGVGNLVHGAVERIRSQAETAAAAEAQHAAYLAEQEAREEAESLYRVSEEINAANSFHDIVRAVAKLNFGPGDIYLNIFENFNFEGARYFDIVATATDMFKHEGARWWIADFELIKHIPRQDVFVNENIAANPNIDARSKQKFIELGVHSNMRVSLNLNNRWMGGLGIDSPVPRRYSDREKRLMAGVGDLVSAAVERIRLQQETVAAAEAQRQALLAEKDAREEREILFRASQAINAANTFHEIVEAVNHVDFGGDFYLSIFENFDHQNATYIESVSTARGEFVKEPRRFSLGEMPFFKDHARPGLLIMEDIENQPEIDPITRKTLLEHGIKSGMRFGLGWNGRVLGAFGVDTASARRYSAREQRQMTALGELVSAAVERIRLQKEMAATAEALRQALLAEKEAREEMALLYQVSKAINQASQISEVLEATKRLFHDPVDVAIFAWEDYDRTDATYLESLASTDANLPGGTRLPRALVSGPATLNPTEILVINDVNGPDWAVNPAADSARYFGLHSICCANLMHSHRVEGLFAIASYAPYEFMPQEVRLMVAIADLTAAALERFRSRQAEAEANEEREQLFRASRAINAANSFREILNAVNHIDFDGGDCYLYIYENFDFHTASYIETVATGQSQFMSEGMRIPLADVPFLKEHPRPGLWAYEDVANHPELDPVTKATMMNQGVASNLRYGLSRNNRILGAFGVDHGTPKIYSARERRMINALGDLISAAVERIRLQQETHAAREKAERLAERAQQLAALEERTRLARELHDSVSQALYGIGLGAQTARAMWEKDQTLVKESVEYVLTLAEAALVEMRALIFELRPESLENEGLITALAKQGASLQARHGLDMRLELGEEPTLSLDMKEALYRIAREALHNVVKHAGATKAILRLTGDSDNLLLEVIDNGAGFDTDRDFPGHLGLQSMRERVEQLGGEIQIESAVGKGTHITVKICLSEDAPPPSKVSNETVGREDG